MLHKHRVAQFKAAHAPVHRAPRQPAAVSRLMTKASETWHSIPHSPAWIYQAWRRSPMRACTAWQVCLQANVSSIGMLTLAGVVTNRVLSAHCSRQPNKP